MRILGIETTCDETAAAVVERSSTGEGRILSNVVLSQVSEHAAYGGVVPEIAARAHVEALDHIISNAMAEAGCGFNAIDGIAAAAGPRGGPPDPIVSTPVGGGGCVLRSTQAAGAAPGPGLVGGFSFRYIPA